MPSVAGTSHVIRATGGLRLVSSLGQASQLHPILAHSVIAPSTRLPPARALHFKADGPEERQETPKDRFGHWTLPHPRYTTSDLEKMKVVHQPSATGKDRIAETVLKLTRTVFDLATRYPSHRSRFPPIKRGTQAQPPNSERLATELSKYNIDPADVTDKTKDSPLPAMDLAEMRKKGMCFGPEAWLTRIVFLETVAGAPGLVGGMVRHLQSLRLMRRDKGWIATLLEEAENERMHLLTFLTYAKPGPFMRLMILVAQGVFTNVYFLIYLLAPQISHRFIGYLEEEATKTYTRIIQDLDEGRLPEWENLAAPQIAISYWSLAKDAKMRDVLLAVRADEAVHRFVNHSLANVGTDAMNPFAQALPPASIYATKVSFSKEEAEEWAEQAAKLAAERESPQEQRQTEQSM
ncbi:inducible alternative oxidase 2 [Tilletia horrida]|uniref:Alternative oxidase n=1 Tax=Tilletia horrida TaxID=155126 RepID=A0AAN6GM04_9BASI|nr:inducible alternative oxidase 2 [Tilletia horrida]